MRKADDGQMKFLRPLFAAIFAALFLLFAWSAIGSSTARAAPAVDGLISPVSQDDPIADRWVQSGASGSTCTRTFDSDNDEWDYSEACATIQEALNVARPGETIHVAGSFTYGAIAILKDVTIIGGYAPGFGQMEAPPTFPGTFPTTVNGIQVTAGKVTLQGLHVSNPSGSGIYVLGPSVELSVEGSWIHGNGNTGVNGGGIAVVSAATVKLEDVDIYQNSAASGGGIYVGAGELSISGNSTVYNNNATNGGGLYASSPLTVTVAGITLTTNSATQGGAIYAQNSKLVVEGDARLISNQATSQGGAVYVSGGTPSFNSVLLQQNNAPAGGGIYASRGIVLLQ